MVRTAAEQQKDRNEQTRQAWELFAEHRRRVSGLLRPNTANAGSLLLVGAGNCNDVDLAEQLDHYAEVVLADIDPAALHYGTEQQKAADRTGLRLIRYDASGLFEKFTAWQQQAPADDDVRAALQLAFAHPPALPWPVESFVTTASLCLLSQLVEAAGQTLGSQHPLLLELLLALRQHHVRALMASTAPGGRVVLVVDFVSSLTLPELDVCPPDQLAPLVRRALQAGNFFTGLHPQALTQSIVHDPLVATRLSSVQITPVWRWDLGPRRYAVCGLELRLK